MKRLTFALLLACLLLGGGCFQRDPYTGSRNPFAQRQTRKRMRAAEPYSQRDTGDGETISLPRWGE